MKNVALPHLFILGALLGAITFLLWLFSPKQIASFSDIADTYGEIIGGGLGIAGAFGVALFTLHSERRQRKARIAIGVAEVLHRLRDEMANKIEWSLIRGLGLGLMNPAPTCLADLEAYILETDETNRIKLLNAINESFIRNPNSLRLDEYSRDIEELPIDLHEKIVSLRENCKIHDNEKLFYHGDINAVNLTYFIHSASFHMKNTVKIIIECENIINFLRINCNSKLRKIEPLPTLRFNTLVKSISKEI